MCKKSLKMTQKHAKNDQKNRQKIQNLRLFYTKPDINRVFYWFEHRKIGRRKQLFLVLKNRKTDRNYYHKLSLPVLKQMIIYAEMLGRTYNLDQAKAKIRFENLQTWEKLIGEDLFKKIAEDRQAPICFKNINLHDFNSLDFVIGSCGNCNLTKSCTMKIFLYKRFKINQDKT